MSVASLAGYLANGGGGGGGTTYYKSYSIPSSTELTPLETPTQILADGEIIPPAGTYLINTFIAFKSYDGNDDPAGNIRNASVSVLYGNNLVVNNQTYYSDVTNNENVYFLQTSGVFTSDGTQSLLMTVNAINADGAVSYNILTGGNQIPQVQIISLSGGGGGGGNVNEIISGFGINVTDEGGGVFSIENDGIISAKAGAGIEVSLDTHTGILTITNTGGGGGGGNTFQDVIIGVGEELVTLSCDDKNLLLIDGQTAATQAYVNANFLSLTDAASTYQPQSEMNEYVTATAAGATFQTINDMAAYPTLTQANGIFQPIGNYVIAPTISSFYYFQLNSNNTDYLPYTMTGTLPFFAAAFNFPTLPYNVNNSFFVTPIFSPSEAVACFQRYAVSEIQNGTPTDGTKGTLDFLNTSTTKDAILLEIFVLVITPS